MITQTLFEISNQISSQIAGFIHTTTHTSPIHISPVSQKKITVMATNNLKTLNIMTYNDLS